MFLVTFHGSRPTHDQDSKSATINNVYAYDDHWNLLSDAALGMGSSGLELAELRGMALDATGRLYVVNAYKKLNQIVRYTSSEEPPRPASAALFEYDRVFAQGRNAYPNPPTARFHRASVQYLLRRDNGIRFQPGHERSDPVDSGRGRRECGALP